MTFENERTVKFQLQYRDNIEMPEEKGKLESQGIRVTYMDFANGIITAEAPESTAEQMKEVFRRTMITYNDAPYKYEEPKKEAPVREPKNPVKKMEKTKLTIMEPRAIGEGYHEVEIEKNLWMCKVCGLVWNMRYEAQSCQHKPTYTRVYGGYVDNGKIKGGKVVTFHAVRQDEVKTSVS